jgi:hypothetical protein
MSGSSGARETNEAASKAAWSAAAASPGLAAPRKIRISETLALFQQRWWEQQFDGVSAQEFANKYNLTVKSVTDQTFLTAGDNLCGCTFGEWVEGGNHAEFNATGLRNYKDCLQSDIKSVSNIYLALNRFAHPSARISLQGYLEQVYALRAVFGWGGQRYKATNRQAEQASPPNPTKKSPNIKFKLSLLQPLFDDLVVCAPHGREDHALPIRWEPIISAEERVLKRGRLRSFTAILPDAIGASPEVQLLKSEAEL